MVPFISAYLSGREDWSPKRLTTDAGRTFEGSKVYSAGFVITNENAQRMLDADARNVDVIFPYLNGQDLNSESDQRPSRWVINFWDWPAARARAYRLPWQWVEENVKPDRFRQHADGRYVCPDRLREEWWLFERRRADLYHYIGRGHLFAQHPDDWDPNTRPLHEVLVAARVGKYFNPSVITNDVIFHDKCVVFATPNTYAFGALFNSSPVQTWVWQQSSRLKLDLNFSPSDAIETFPFPSPDVLASFDRHGREYMQARREVMTDAANPMGLTKLYNRFHDPDDVDPRIVRLREMHRAIDTAVMRAYGWDDLDLGHGHHQQPNLAENDRVRFTISDAARAEVLRRFAELNREHYEKEHASAPAAKPRASKGRAKSVPASQGALAPVDAPAPTSKTKAAPAQKGSKRRSG
jgi:hypothetical protein